MRQLICSCDSCGRDVSFRVSFTALEKHVVTYDWNRRQRQHCENDQRWKYDWPVPRSDPDGKRQGDRGLVRIIEQNDASYVVASRIKHHFGIGDPATIDPGWNRQDFARAGTVACHDLQRNW